MKFPSTSSTRRRSAAGALALAALVVAGSLGAQGTTGADALNPRALKYPPTARGEQTDDLAGIRVADPYRWLENVASTEIRNWVEAQNAVTESWLARVPGHADLWDIVSRAWNYAKVSTPFAAGERTFYFENSGLENQSTLYVQDRPALPARPLIDPNAFSQDGLIAIVDQAASPDGRYLAYAVTTQGSGWRTVRVRDVKSGQDTGEEIHGVRSGPLSWTNDERGFFYTRSDAGRATTAANPLAPDGRDQIYYHRVGQAQAGDRLVFESAQNPSWKLRADVSQDGQYLVISARYGVEQNRLFLIDLDNPKRPNLNAPIVKLFDAGDAVYEFVGNSGPVFFIRTTKNAPRARIVAVDINTPDENHWTTLVRETYDPLIALRRVDDRLVVHRLHDAHSVLELYGLDGSPRGTIPLPGVGTVTSMNANSENRELYFSFTSFLQPPTVYRYDLDARNTVVYRETHADSSLTQYETAQLFYTSKDGTRIPMFITARRGITLNGSHPTILSGIGAFNTAATPKFSPSIAAWLHLGGVYAVANVRGGGEYGRAWHDSAMGRKKQTSVDDFVAAAEFLIGQRYTRPASLAVEGRAAGGLLVGAAITQHPELFGAAVIDAGILDMARFSRLTVGAEWTPEFGSLDKASDVRALLAYSPLQNVRPDVRYPATLVCVGERDDIVTPAHSYKFVAALQAAPANSSPALLRVDYNVGFEGAPISRQIALDRDRIVFLVDALHVTR